MKIKAIRILFTSAFVALIFVIFTMGYIMNMKSGIADSVLRLHIVGATDSEADQALKLRVRDRILKDFSEVFSDCSSLSDSKLSAGERISQIQRSAEDELRQHGCYEPVSANIERCAFPTKTYGSVTLPSGSYTALNIRIGKAEGQNWWCVMYPPLCITDKIVEVPDSSKEKLKECLTPEEYRLITESDAPDIKIKFRIAEILGNLFG